MTNGEVPHFDVIIVGAGPAGSDGPVAALDNAAKA